MQFISEIVQQELMSVSFLGKALLLSQHFNEKGNCLQKHRVTLEMGQRVVRTLTQHSTT